MKRRLAAFIICLLLVFQLALPPARAADRVCFTAVGSYVLPLSDNTMPFWSGGYVYIASSIFTGAAREALNVSQVLDNSLEWVVLYSGSGGRSLTFNLSANCALDNNGDAHYPGAILRNGTVFVPAYTVSRYFDLVYSVIEVERGSMVWLRQPNYNVPDKQYADAAKYNMNSVYRDYIRAKEAAQSEGSSSPGGSVKPITSAAPEDPTAELNGKRVALCLAVGNDASAMADALEAYNAGAALFFTPEDMARQGDAVRRLLAAGQSVGILADANDPEHTVAEQLEAGNAALFQAACGKTRLAYIQNSGAQSLQTARDMGFRCLQPEVDRSSQSLLNISTAQSLLQRVAGWQGNPAVWLGSGASATGLRAFLSAAREAGGVCVAYNETGVN